MMLSLPLPSRGRSVGRLTVRVVVKRDPPPLRQDENGHLEALLRFRLEHGEAKGVSERLEVPLRQPEVARLQA